MKCDLNAYTYTIIYAFDSSEDLLENADALLESLNLDPEKCEVTITATVSVTVNASLGVAGGAVTTTVSGSVTTTCRNATAAGVALVKSLRAIVGA